MNTKVGSEYKKMCPKCKSEMHPEIDSGIVSVDTPLGDDQVLCEDQYWVCDNEDCEYEESMDYERIN